MDKDTKAEALLGAVDLDAYNISAVQIERIQMSAERIFARTFEYVGGRRVTLSKPRKKALFRAEARKIIGRHISVEGDALNQARGIDAIE